MAEKLLKYDVAMKSTKTMWQMDIPRANTGDENTVTFDFNITDLDSAELTGATPNVNLYMRDGSFFQCRPEEGVELNGQRVTYTMRENEGKHNGKAKAELVLIWPGTNPIQKLTSQQYAFEIANGLDTVVAVEVMIQDWTTLTAEAQVYLDQMAEKHAIADADHTRAETDHTTAVADHTTAASDHTTALADHAVTADMILDGTNLVTNGDFSNGVTGWTGYNLVSPATVSGGIVSFTPNVLYGGIARVVLTKSQSRIYVRVRAKTNAPNIMVVMSDNVNYSLSSKLASSGNWVDNSSVMTIGASQPSADIIVRSQDASTWGLIEVESIFALDLTTTFGAGNEPTVEQMDAIMAKFPNSWFDGTKNLFRAKEALTKQLELDARTEFDAKNLVANGDFSNGLTGWTIDTSSVLTVSNNELFSTGNGNFHINQAWYVGKGVPGHKYYTRAVCRVTNSDCLRIQIVPFGNYTGIDNPVANVSYPISVISTHAEIAFLEFWHTYPTAEIGNGKVMGIKNVIMIDLTATFGAGKEPTLAEMDRLMARYPNSWFDGVKPIQTIETLYQEKANKVQEAWITPTLINGWTQKEGFMPIGYMKDQFGFVHIKGLLNAVGATNGVIFTLPATYRPTSPVYCIGNTEDKFASLVIQPDGKLSITTAATNWLSLDSVQYKVEQ